MSILALGPADLDTGGGLLTHVAHLLSQRHPYIVGRTCVIHSKEGGEEAQWQLQDRAYMSAPCPERLSTQHPGGFGYTHKEDGHQGEGHDGAALFYAFPRLDNAGLLLLER